MCSSCEQRVCMQENTRGTLRGFATAGPVAQSLHNYRSFFRLPRGAPQSVRAARTTHAFFAEILRAKRKTLVSIQFLSLPLLFLSADTTRLVLLNLNIRATNLQQNDKFEKNNF